MKSDLAKGISEREKTSNSEKLRKSNKGNEYPRQTTKTVKDKRGSFKDLC